MYSQLAWRNIWRNPRRTLIILTAVFIGVASMILLAALMRGMMEGMVNNAINNLAGHIRIQQKDYREDPSIDNRIKAPGDIVQAIRPVLPEDARLVQRIRVEGVINTARENRGVVVVGTRLEQESGISFIGDAPIEGSGLNDDDPGGIVIGKSLLEKLETRIGNRIVLMSQGSDAEIASQAFRIRGVYHAQMKETEDSIVFISLYAARRFLGLGEESTEISIVLPGDRMADADLSPITRTMQENLPGYPVVVEDWGQMLPALSAYMKMFDGFLVIWYVVVFIAMGFGIVNTVLMAVYERMREFGLLKAIGMRPVSIFRMVLRETLMLLFIGITAGNAAAFLGIKLFAMHGIDLSSFAAGVEMWGMDRVIFPVLMPGDVLLANLTVFILGVMVGVYPALKAARFTPVETMRNL